MTQKQYWQLWQLRKTDDGRQVWDFSYTHNGNAIAAHDTFWNTPEGENVLTEMMQAFAYDKKNNPNAGDKVYRSMHEQAYNANSGNAAKKTLNERAKQAAHLAMTYYRQLQGDDGHWPGDYGGPLFLMPGLIIASYVTQTPFSKPHRALMKQYMLNMQNSDGGWGLHIEGASTMFGTVLQYVSLRILGCHAQQAELIKARRWIQQNGGATHIPSWGKFFLSVLGVYEWEGCNSLLPELWLLPKSLPIHPWRYWCHCRMVYLPMAYCYGHRISARPSELTEALKNEIYAEDYTHINWKAARDLCADADMYFHPSPALRLMNLATNAYEKIAVKGWRKKALDFVIDYVHAEDIQTNFIDIGPVNKAINSICVWHACGKDDERFKKHTERWLDYLWVAEDGMKMQGYNGSQMWDTAFATQAMCEGEMENGFADVMQKAHNYLEVSQVIEEVDEPVTYFRHPSKGAWPFSTRAHGWPISDCTAEGLKATLLLQELDYCNLLKVGKRISDERLQDAVDVILSYQNKNGGWATYEQTRGPQWLELINPSEVFGEIMIDYAHTECTSACMQALQLFKKYYPHYRKNEIEKAVASGLAFIKSKQREDGSWYGGWAVCFTYGTWFGMHALTAAGEPGFEYGSEVNTHIRNACRFLIDKQNADGGWGESFESCVSHEYVPAKHSQVVNTAWALLALMNANYPDRTVIDKGVKFLMSRQQANGDWLQENISGVFNHNCMITYTAYRNVFPLWALNRYHKRYASVD